MLGCTGGVVQNIYENKTGKIIGMAMSSLFGVGDAHFRTGTKEGYTDTVAFGAYLNKVFREIGYFDEALSRNQDDEFNYRLVKHGFKISLRKNIRSRYFVRGSFKKLFRQYFQYGYWKVFVNKKHNTITTFRQLIPLIFVIFLFLGIIVSFIDPLLRILFVMSFIFYLFLGAIFAILKSNKITIIAGMVYTFFILHFSYGLGYLTGLYRFVLLRKSPASRQERLSR
jgi:hypothetical protein